VPRLVDEGGGLREPAHVEEIFGVAHRGLQPQWFVAEICGDFHRPPRGCQSLLGAMRLHRGRSQPAIEPDLGWVVGELAEHLLGPAEFRHRAPDIHRGRPARKHQGQPRTRLRALDFPADPLVNRRRALQAIDALGLIELGDRQDIAQAFKQAGQPGGFTAVLFHESQRGLPVLGGLFVGEGGVGGCPRAKRVGDCFFPIAERRGGHRMIGQLVEVSLGLGAVELLEYRKYLLVQAQPPGSLQLLIGDVAYQCVGKLITRAACRGWGDNFGGGRGVEHAHQVVSRHLAYALQGSELELASQRCRRRQDAIGRLGQRGKPAANRNSNAAGNREPRSLMRRPRGGTTRRHERSDHFRHEERVSSRGPMQVRHKARAGRTPDALLDELRNFRFAQSAERELA
jgi:hypothetical protein